MAASRSSLTRVADAGRSGERLALDGGPPVRSTYLPYGHQVVTEDDIKAVAEVMTSDWLTTGPAVERFENALARFVTAKHGVAVANGTAALHAAMFAAKIGPGDEVIVPALTFAATANCVRYVGATVVFADVRPDTLTMDVDAARRLITDRTKAIITVDYSGQPSDLADLLALTRDRRIVLVDDAAHALGAEYRGKRVGTIADLTTFSFHPVKQMTTGEGGMVTTNDDEAAERLRRFRNHGMSRDARERESVVTWRYEMPELGYNYRLNDIQCALGLSQLERLPGALARRTLIAMRYRDALSSLPEIELSAVLDDRVSSWHLFVVRLRLERLHASRERLFRALRAENIGVNVHYIPVPWLEYYQQLGYARGSWPVSEDAYERMLTLPLWSGMTDTDVDDVITAVEKVCRAEGA